MEQSKELRELVRLLIKKLGILQKGEAMCCGVTMAQCHAIVEIGRSGNLSLNQLSEILDLDNSTTSRTVNNLVNLEYVERNVDPDDRRFVTIQLTEKGKEVFKNLEFSMDTYYNNVMKNIPEDKRGEVLEGLRILSEALTKIDCC